MGERCLQSQPRRSPKSTRNQPKLPSLGTHDRSLAMSDRDRKPPFRRTGGKPSARPSGLRPTWQDRDHNGPAVLYGWHTVTLALQNPQRRIRKLILTENAARRLAKENIALPISPNIVRPNEIDRLLTPDAVHQ